MNPIAITIAALVIIAALGYYYWRGSDAEEVDREELERVKHGEINIDKDEKFEPDPTQNPNELWGGGSED